MIRFSNKDVHSLNFIKGRFSKPILAGSSLFPLGRLPPSFVMSKTMTPVGFIARRKNFVLAGQKRF